MPGPTPHLDLRVRLYGLRACARGKLLSVGRTRPRHVMLPGKWTQERRKDRTAKWTKNTPSSAKHLLKLGIFRVISGV
jgi:hypothetical protein